MSRRAVGLAAVAGLAEASGCSGTRSSAGRASHPASPIPVSPSSGRTLAPALPAVTPWLPGPGEVSPAAKRHAVHHVEQAGNGPHRALQVIDAQYGGILADSASVLVVTRDWWLPAEADTLREGGHTFDVRLSRGGSGWRVTAVHPSHPGPPRRPGRLAHAVLRSPRIDLPPAARADIASGRVHASVLGALLEVSRHFHVGVSVVRSGHPLFVFGTNRLSDHPQGRAVDTWHIDGHPVVDPGTSESLVAEYMHAMADAGSYNVGGPYLLGAAPQWFSDATHHDHVHAGFVS